MYAQVFGDKPKQNTIKNEVINTGDDDTATDPEVLNKNLILYLIILLMIKVMIKHR